MSEMHHPNYVKIWAILVVLLVISVAGPFLEIPTSHHHIIERRGGHLQQAGGDHASIIIRQCIQGRAYQCRANRSPRRRPSKQNT